MASYAGHRNQSVPNTRPGSAAGRAARGKPTRSRANAASSQLEVVQERVGDWVAERPWTMVGAATGVGLAVGVATRTRASRELGRMLASTASGIAVRYALNALTQWFEASGTPESGHANGDDGGEPNPERDDESPA